MIKSIQTSCSNHQIVKLHRQLKSLSKRQIKKELMVCKKRLIINYAIVFTFPTAKDITEDLLLELELLTVPFGEPNVPLLINFALGGT